MENADLINLLYLVSAIFFIVGLKGLTKPKSAVRGNLLGSVGMLIAVVTVLTLQGGLSFGWIIAGLITGGIIGLVFAIKVEMTSMPELVAMFNGFGGLASVLVAGGALAAELLSGDSESASAAVDALGVPFLVATAASGVIGSITFTGSIVAYGKLSGKMNTGAILPFGAGVFRHLINAALVLATIALCAFFVMHPEIGPLYILIVFLALIVGILLVIPIGGADMPVVIALLNSYSGIAAAATGFVLSNSVLIVSGSLVGASGLILTQIMCKAMNRSIVNVIFGLMGGSETASADDVYEGKIKSTSADEIAMIMDGARRVVIVPGYGMAVAQAQHAVRDLMNQLEANGTEVEFAIHPVAGRMPGHMNVLLAEAEIPYDKLIEMDEINPTFPQTDVTIVIGANDVVNPLARTDPQSPIAGMPILNVDKSHTVVVIKRSLSPGFAGIPNPLFAADNTLMFFADGKEAVGEIVKAVKDL